MENTNDVRLDGRQIERLNVAIRSAFPQPNALERLVRYRLDKNLAEIGSGSHTDVTFRLVQWAEASGKLRALIAEAVAEQPENATLREFVESIGFGVLSSLGVPEAGKAGVLVDLSHDQSSWADGSIFDLSDSLLLPQHLAVKPVTDRHQLTADALKGWQGLLLGLPYHQRITDATRYELVKWVRRGGRLALLGFELGERHHETNINELADEFGLRFNSDIVAPKGWKPPGKPYGKAVDFDGIQSHHPILKGVERLRLWNLCTINLEPGADALLCVGDNKLGRLKKEGVRYDPKGWLRGGNQQFDSAEWARWSSVIAEAPGGLTGLGKVAAIGTWEIFQRVESAHGLPDGFDNGRFLENLFNWLGDH